MALPAGESRLELLARTRKLVIYPGLVLVRGNSIGCYPSIKARYGRGIIIFHWQLMELRASEAAP